MGILNYGGPAGPDYIHEPSRGLRIN